MGWRLLNEQFVISNKCTNKKQSSIDGLRPYRKDVFANINRQVRNHHDSGVPSK